MSTTVDCRGMVCPQPVLTTKERLEQMAAGTIEVIVDNPASKSNVERFARSQGCEVSIRAEGDAFYLTISKPEGAAPAAGTEFAAEDYRCDLPGGPLVYVIPADTMGRGDEELGRVLIRAFVKTIREVTPKPAKILFYNNGVKLTATDSDLIEPLRELEAQGVVILSCGTCLDYFNLKDRLLVGTVTNMFEIMTAMAEAGRLVSPF